MNRLTLYLLRQLFVATLFVTLALASAILLAQSLRLIDLVIDGGAPFWMFLWLMGLTLPTFLGIILPIGLFGAVLFIYNRLTVDSELIVMKAAGLDAWALARPAFLLAAVVAWAVLMLNLHITPAAHRELARMEYLVRNEYASILLRDGTFNDVDAGITVYLRDRTSEGELTDILIHDARDKARPVTLMSRRGVLASGPVGPRVVMYDGIREEVGDAPGQISHLYFDRYVVDLKVLRADLPERWEEPRERGIHDLIAAGNDPGESRNLPRFLAEMHLRLSTPLFAFSFTLIGLAALLSGDFSRRGQNLRITLATVMVVVLEGAALGLANAASKNPLFAPLLYLVVSVPALVGARMMHHRLRPIPAMPPPAPAVA